MNTHHFRQLNGTLSKLREATTAWIGNTSSDPIFERIDVIARTSFMEKPIYMSSGAGGTRKMGNPRRSQGATVTPVILQSQSILSSGALASFAVLSLSRSIGANSTTFCHGGLLAGQRQIQTEGSTHLPLSPESATGPTTTDCGSVGIIHPLINPRTSLVQPL